MLIDAALQQHARSGRPVKVGLIGAGTMGCAIVRQVTHSVPGMDVIAISNRTPEKAARAYAEAGITDIAEASEQSALQDALAKDKPVVVSDPGLLCEAEGIDVLVDATGAIDFGADLALQAIACGRDMVSLNVELIATVGPIIQSFARKAGVIYAIADGDQPGTEINLWRHVKALGLQPLVCGNIKGLQDVYRNPDTQKGFAEKWGQNARMVTSFADGSKISMEQACVANVTGMQVEMRGMRGGDFEGHVDDLCHSGRYDVEKIRSLGGVVDYTVKSRPAPGVFVLAVHDDPVQQKMLDMYKLGSGPLYSFYTPYHLCHFEVPLSAARAVLFREMMLKDEVRAGERPMVDVVAVAKRDLLKGETLDGIGGFQTYGQCENYPIVRAERLLPQGLAEGCLLKCDISRDSVISYADVILPEESTVHTLRARQDRLFPV